MFDKNKYLHLFNKNSFVNVVVIEEVISELENLTLPVLLKGSKPKMYNTAKKFLWIGEKEAYHELLLDIEILYSKRDKLKNEKKRLNI